MARQDIEILARALCREHEIGASDHASDMKDIISKSVEENWPKWVIAAEKLADELYGPLLEVCKDAYSKHVLEDANIGWEELGEQLSEALVNTMGDDEYNRWVDRKEK